MQIFAELLWSTKFREKENYESLETAWVRLVTLKRKEKRRKSNNYLLSLLDRLSPGINRLMVIYSYAEMEGNRRGFASRYRLLSNGEESFYRGWH